MSNKFFRSIFSDFDELKEMINEPVSVDKPFRIVKGFMQSRKTQVMIATALYYVLVRKESVIMVIQNSLDACTQLCSRFTDIIRNTIGSTESLDSVDKSEQEDEFIKLLKVQDVKRGKMLGPRRIKKVLSSETPRIYVCLRNASDLGNLNDVLTDIENPLFSLIIDECDLNDSKSVSAAQDILDNIKVAARIIWCVTATPLSSVMKDIIDAGHVYIMKKPVGYKDLPNMDFKKLPKPASYCESVESDPFEKDENLADYIRDFSLTNPFYCSFWSEKHPRISLVRIGATVKPQEMVAEYIHANFGNRIVAITYNGSGYGISIRGKTFGENSVVIDGTHSRVSVDDSKDDPKYVHTFSNIHIGKILQYLQKIGVKTIKRIMILAGKMADRGITFGSANYAECIKNKKLPWHLTEMYFLPAAGMIQANLLQAAGRLCGVYTDNIPLTIYSTACEDIIKAYHVQEELIERARESKCNSALRDIICTQPISKEKICKGRRLTSLGIKCNLKKVADDTKYGGWNWKAEGRMREIDCAEFGDGDRPETIHETLTDEEIEKVREEARLGVCDLDNEDEIEIKEAMDYIRRAYNKKSTYIHRIINAFVKAEFTSLSVEELREATRKTMNISNYDRWDIKHNKYKLLEVTDTGNYNLCANVIENLGLFED